jgi:hydrogenase-4 component F
MPLLGILTFIGALSLAGTPPFNIFLSEFTILKAGVDKGMWLVVALFLLFVVIVFYGILSGFGKMLFGSSQQSAISHQQTAFTERESSIANALSNTVMIIMALFVIVLGFKIPDFIDGTIKTCISVLGVK